MSSVNAASSNQVMPQAQVVPVSELNGPSATLSDSSKAAVRPEVSVLKATELDKAKALDKDQLQEAVDVMNQAVIMDKRSLSFSVDDLSGRSIIMVKDIQTEQLIRQIPTEEILKVAQDIKRLQDEMGQSIGLLIDKRV